MKNVITVDVEDWYHAHVFNIDRQQWPRMEDRVMYNTERLLDLFAQFNTKGTFFVLGSVAKKHPELIKKIARMGHETGSHGYWHSLIYRQSRKEFRSELAASKNILEDLTGHAVRSFRAPSWSISPETIWAIEILNEEGFTCDSSLQPFVTPLSGMKGIPLSPFRPEIKGRVMDIVEFPPTVLNFGKLPFPFAGGFYLRAVPLGLIMKSFKAVNKTRPGMIYVHPWEIDTGQPRIKLPIPKRLVHYYNLGSTLEKLTGLLNEFKFSPLIEVVREGGWASWRMDSTNGR